MPPSQSWLSQVERELAWARASAVYWAQLVTFYITDQVSSHQHQVGWRYIPALKNRVFAPSTEINKIRSSLRLDRAVVLRDELPRRMWSLLHRSLDIIADSGHAVGQTGGRALRATLSRLSLRDLWPARASRGVCELARWFRHVRHESP